MNREHSLKTALDECVRFEDEVRAEMLAERARAEAAEAQRDRLAEALRKVDGEFTCLPSKGLGHDTRCPAHWRDDAPCLRAIAHAALADVPERCDHVEHVPGGGDVRCSEPAGHEEGAHMGMIRDVLAATDVPDADRRRDEAYRAMVEACEEAKAHINDLREAWVRGVLRESDNLGGTRSNRNVDVQTALERALALARQVEE